MIKDRVLIKPPFEKAEDLLQLALGLVAIILESFISIISLIKSGHEEVCTPINPKPIDDAELVACTVDELVLNPCLSMSTFILETSIIRATGCEVARSSALQSACSTIPIAAVVVVIGESIREFKTKGLIFLVECVVPSLKPSGNLQNTIT